MTNIASQSPEVQEVFVNSALKPGNILHIFIKEHPFNKFKFVLVLHTDPSLGVFFINSGISNFINNSPSHYAGQILARTTELGFLNYDSWIDCSQIYSGLNINEVRKQIIEDYSGTVKTSIPDSLRQKILQVTSQQDTLSRSEIDIIRNNLLP